MEKFKSLIYAFQFIALTVFLLLSRIYGWELAFQVAGLVALVQFTLLFYFKRTIVRLLSGVNVFLIFGGLAFFLDIEILQLAMQNLMESLMFISIFVVFVVATFVTKSGVFEAEGRKNKKFSLIMIGLSLACVFWSYFFKNDIIMAGTIPFLVLFVVKSTLERKL